MRQRVLFSSEYILVIVTRSVCMHAHSISTRAAVRLHALFGLGAHFWSSFSLDKAYMEAQLLSVRTFVFFPLHSPWVCSYYSKTRGSSRLQQNSIPTGDRASPHLVIPIDKYHGAWLCHYSEFTISLDTSTCANVLENKPSQPLDFISFQLGMWMEPKQTQAEWIFLLLPDPWELACPLKMAESLPKFLQQWQLASRYTNTTHNQIAAISKYPRLCCLQNGSPFCLFAPSVWLR